MLGELERTSLVNTDGQIEQESDFNELELVYFATLHLSMGFVWKINPICVDDRTVNIFRCLVKTIAETMGVERMREKA